MGLSLSWTYYGLWSRAILSLAANGVTSVHVLLIVSWLVCHCYYGNSDNGREEELNQFAREDSRQAQMNNKPKILLFTLLLSVTVLVGGVLLSIDVSNKDELSKHQGAIEVGILAISLIGLTSFGFICSVVTYFIDYYTAKYFIGRYLDYRQRKRLERLRDHSRENVQNQYYTFSS